MSLCLARSSRIALLVLVLVLAASWASASQPRGRHAQRSRDVASNSMSWSLLEMLRGFFTGSWSKNGCSLDPFGRPVCQQDPSSSTPTSENGCSADPDGDCMSGQ
jgi:hypothetical protein